MHRLPALVAGSHRGVLPMADGSAAALVEVLLADERSAAVARLAEALAVDPPLALWSVAMAAGDGTPPEDVGHLAAWLAEHAPRVLRWDPKQERPLYVADAAEAALYAGRVAEVLEVAELAALAARSEGDEAADRAYLDGLLHDAPRWFMLSGHRSLKSASRYLPETLAGRKGDPVNPHVARTVEALRWQASGGRAGRRGRRVPPSRRRGGSALAAAGAGGRHAAARDRRQSGAARATGIPFPRDARSREARRDGRVCRWGGPRNQQPAGRHRRPGPTVLAGRRGPRASPRAGVDQHPGEAGVRDDRRHDALRPTARSRDADDRTGRAGRSPDRRTRAADGRASHDAFAIGPRRAAGDRGRSDATDRRPAGDVPQRDGGDRPRRPRRRSRWPMPASTSRSE